jgi:hypothetical protein
VKFAGLEYVKHLHQLIGKIWITETIPEEWYLSIVCPIHKKGDVMVCSNYRGIRLLCIAYKTCSNILFNRLSPCVEGIIGDYQCGFRQGRSICDQISAIRHILEKCNEFQIETHNLSIDFWSAYDTIDRDNLYRAMEEMHIPQGEPYSISQFKFWHLRMILISSVEHKNPWMKLSLMWNEQQKRWIYKLIKTKQSICL